MHHAADGNGARPRGGSRVPGERPARPSASLRFPVTSPPPADLSFGDTSRRWSPGFHPRSASRPVRFGSEPMDFLEPTRRPARSRTRGAKDPPEPFEVSRDPGDVRRRRVPGLLALRAVRSLQDAGPALRPFLRFEIQPVPPRYLLRKSCRGPPSPGVHDSNPRRGTLIRPLHYLDR